MTEFLYRPFLYKDREGKTHRLLKPIIPVFLNHREYSCLVDMVVDSGAEISLIPRSTGDVLKLRVYDRAEIEEMHGLGGGIIPVVYREIGLTIGGHSLRAPVAWSLVEGVPAVLGTERVFDYFHVEFRQSEKKILFKPVKED